MDCTVKIKIVRVNDHGLLTGFSCFLTQMILRWTNKKFPSEQEHMKNHKAILMGYWMDSQPP